MNYVQVRSQILNGDLIAIRKRGGLLPTLTRWVTCSPYTHTAIAVWSGTGMFRRLLVAEAKASGAFLTPLSQYADTDFDVYRAPQETLLYVQEALWHVLGVPIHYDVRDLVRIGLNKLFGVPLPQVDDALLICSALSATIWLQAGWQPYKLPSIPAPGDVVAALGRAPTFAVRAG